MTADEAASGFRASWFSRFKPTLRQRVKIQVHRLVGSRNFRVRYPDGLRSIRGSYNFAWNYREIFGGIIEYDA